jgi:hypothetical protein
MATPRPCGFGPALDMRILCSSADLLALRGFSSVLLVRLFREARWFCHESRPLLTQGRVSVRGVVELNGTPLLLSERMTNRLMGTVKSNMTQTPRVQMPSLPTGTLMGSR